MSVRDRERPDLLLFLHIPKAGGSTLHAILDREYGRGPTVWTTDWPDEEEIGRLPLEERAAIDLIKGHFHFGLHRLFPQQAAYVTLVRDPVARVISHYHYVRHKPEHPLHRRVVDGGLSLREYVTAGLSDELENGQTRLLSTRARESGTCDRACLEEAKHNLVEHFPVVGVTERFDESILLFRQTFGWRLPLYAPINVARQRDRTPVDAETRQSIRERNGLDEELYAFVVGRLEDAIASAGNEFQRALHRFRRINGPVGHVAGRTRRLRQMLRAR